MTIKFDYMEVGFNGPMCCLSFMAEDLLKGRVWHGRRKGVVDILPFVPDEP